MKSAKSVLSIALAALGCGGIYLWHTRDTVRQQVESAPVVSAPTFTSAAAYSDRAIIEDPPVAEVLPPPVHVANRPSVPQGVAILREQMASPESIEQARISRKGRMYVLYPDLGNALGISAEQENQLYGLLEQQFANKLPQNRNDTSIPDFARTRRENQTEIASLLGDRYSKWQEYEQEVPSRRELRDLRAVLNANKTPLTEAQEASVLRALVGAQQQILQAGDVPGASPRNTRKYLEAVSPYLSPQQFDAFEKMLERKVKYGSVLGTPG